MRYLVRYYDHKDREFRRMSTTIMNAALAEAYAYCKEYTRHRTEVGIIAAAGFELMAKFQGGSKRFVTRSTELGRFIPTLMRDVDEGKSFGGDFLTPASAEAVAEFGRRFGEVLADDPPSDERVRLAREDAASDIQREAERRANQSISEALCKPPHIAQETLRVLWETSPVESVRKMAWNAMQRMQAEAKTTKVRRKRVLHDEA